MTTKYVARKQWMLTWSQVSEHLTKEDCLAKLKTIDEVVEYVCGMERHEDGGKHFHAYVKFVGGVAPKDVLKFKWNERTATAKTVRGLGGCVKYCTKDGDYITNVKNIKALIGGAHHKKLTEVLIRDGVDKAVDDGLIPIRNLKRLRMDVADYKLHKVAVVPTDHCKGIWIFGPTGAGKTTEALRRFPEAFRKPPTKWWDGYEGQLVVLLDDLRKTHAQFIVYYLTQWLDRHAPPAGEVKGGNVPLPFEWFVVTSQWSIEELFDEPRDREAIYRRCEGRIYHYVDGREVDASQPPRSTNLAAAGEYDVVPSPSEVLRICETYAATPDGNGGAESASAPQGGLRTDAEKAKLVEYFEGVM